VIRFVLLSFLAFSVAQAEAAEPVKLRLGVAKMASLATPWVAEKQGFFKKYGLSVEVISFRGSVEAIAALHSGSVDVIGAIPGTAFVAIERGFDMVPLSQNETAKAQGPDSGSIQVRKDSPIKSLAQLKGKKIAIPGPRTQKGVVVLSLLRKAGIGEKDVIIQELPLASQAEALRHGRVDAVATVDPYSTQMLKSGIGRVLVWDYVASIPEQPLGIWYVRKKMVQENPRATEGLRKGLAEAVDFLNANPPRARALVAEFTGMDPKLVADMPLPRWSYRIDPAKWQAVIDLMRESGQLKRAHDVSEYLTPQMAPDIIKVR